MILGPSPGGFALVTDVNGEQGILVGFDRLVEGHGDVDDIAGEVIVAARGHRRDEDVCDLGDIVVDDSDLAAVPGLIVPNTDGKGFIFLGAVVFFRNGRYKERIAVFGAGELVAVVRFEVAFVCGVTIGVRECICPPDVVFGFADAHVSGIALEYRVWADGVHRFVVGGCGR